MSKFNVTQEPVAQGRDPVSGIESSPVWRGAFDFYNYRGPYQVRIHIWGWPGKVLWRLLSPKWKARGYTPEPEGEVLLPNVP